MVYLSVAAFALIAINLSSSQYLVVLDTDSPCHEVDDDFLSVTIDAGAIERNFSDIDFQSAKVINLSKALVPVFLRVGGTSGDFLIFKDTTEAVAISRDRKNFTMTKEQFDTINDFVSTVGWRLIFGLNQLLRQPNGRWDSSNAELLIDYSMKSGCKVAWELGNEPDLYENHLHILHAMNGTQGAQGFKDLRKLLAKKKYPVTLLAGPDVATLTRIDYLHDFLAAIGDTINATTWHHYYGNSATEQLSDFYKVEVLDTLIGQIDGFLQVTKSTSFKGNLWLGETSSTYGGGAPLLSSSYLSGFMWLDKLGLIAYHHQKIFRQDLIGGNYGLIESSGNPLPDYWLSYLYKKLVGTKVLNVHGALDKGRKVRVYAHCAKAPYSNGSAVLLILNTINETTPVSLGNEELSKSSRDIYWLTPHPVNNITSRIVALNGNPLALENSDVPSLRPVEQDPDETIKIPGLSFGYIVFRSAKIKACN